MNDVVVTGIGLITPLGVTAAASALAWKAGAVPRRTPLPELAGTPLAESLVARPPEFDAAVRLGRSRRMLKFMSEAAILGCVAAREAADQAGIAGRIAPERIGLYVGSGLAAADVNEIRGLLEASIDEQGEFSCQRLGTAGLAATNPLLSFKILANMPACLVSILEGIRGPSLIFTPWEADGAAALLEAWKAVASGEVDAAITGAADTPAHPSTLAYLRQSGRLAPDECAASSAAYLVLESASRASSGLSSLSWPQLLAATDPAAVKRLDGRLGRCYAAAPAVSLALQVLGCFPEEAIR